jgi:hypothetical protein
MRATCPAHRSSLSWQNWNETCAILLIPCRIIHLEKLLVAHLVKEIPRLLSDPEVHYRVHNKPQTEVLSVTFRNMLITSDEQLIVSNRVQSPTCRTTHCRLFATACSASEVYKLQCLSLDPRFSGSNPDFMGDKNPKHDFLRGGGKSRQPHVVRFYGML